MNVDLVSVETQDSVRLDGAWRKPDPGLTSRLPVDVIICHHGQAGNFYNRYLFNAIGDSFLAEGCAVLRVNSRGHDQAFNGPRGRLGAMFETLEDSHHDWKAWLDFAEAQSYRRIGLWGQSLGAVKTICYLATGSDSRITCAITSSPPRFCYGNSAAAENGAQFEAEIDRARQLVAAGDPEGLVLGRAGTAWFSARTLLDKYGPEDRYDIFRHLPNIPVPLLITLGGEESGTGFQDLASRGLSLDREYKNVSFALIDGADHSYMTRIPQLWSAARSFLGRVATPAAVS